MNSQVRLLDWNLVQTLHQCKRFPNVEKWILSVLTHDVKIQIATDKNVDIDLRLFTFFVNVNVYPNDGK